MKREPKDGGGDAPAPQGRSEAATGVFVWTRRAQGATDADKKGLKMTAAFGLRICALVLCIVTAVHAQPVPDTTRCADSLPTWNDTCSVGVHGTTVRWAVGDSGRVLKVADGDTTAEYVVGRGQFDLYGVSFADAKHGWIVGNKRHDPEGGRGVVFRTTAGGEDSQAWIASCPVVRPDVNVPFVKVQALSPRHVWVTCGSGYMLYTNDGGEGWLVAAKRNGTDAEGSDDEE
jgi:photosystem II stability/assembly factor-like uncharacterized protein